MTNYCLYSYSHWATLLDTKKEIMTGLYNHALAYDNFASQNPKSYAAPVELPDLEKYDIIHINYTTGNFELIHQLGEKLANSSTTLVCNVDYAVENWWNNIPFIDVFESMMKKVDVLFHVESYGAKMLETMLNKERKVHVLPHPADVKFLKSIPHQMQKEGAKRAGMLGWFHRYDPGLMMSLYYGMGGLVDKDGRVIRPHVCGIDTRNQDRVYTHRFAKAWQYSPDWPQLIKTMASYSIWYDPFTMYNSGRIQIEAAALGIPCVSSDRSEAARVLWPELTANPYDWSKHREILQRLINDREYYQSVIEQAWKKVDYYDSREARKRMEAAIQEEAAKRGK